MSKKFVKIKGILFVNVQYYDDNPSVAIQTYKKLDIFYPSGLFSKNMIR